MYKQVLIVLLITIALTNPSSNTKFAQQLPTDAKTLGVVNWPYQICNNTVGIQVLYMQMAQPPAIGTGADINVVGIVKQEFTLMKVDIVVYYKNNFLIDVPVTKDLPKHYKQEQPFLFSYNVTIPSYAFQGHYSINIKFIDDKQNQQLCLAIQMDL